MIKIRKNVFETNSSSTHSLVVCSKEEWEALKNNELFIDVFAAEKNETKLVPESTLIETAKEEYMERDYDPESQFRYHLTWDELYELYKNSDRSIDKKILAEHNINLFGFAGEQYINPNSHVWENHSITELSDGNVKIEFDHFFG